MSTRVEVFIRLKTGMLDPQGATLEHALVSLGYQGVHDLKVGKWITFDLEGDDEAILASRVDEMCRRLLANPVIERYEYRLTGDGSQ